MVRAALSEKRDRVIVTFTWSERTLAKIKSIPGRKYIPADKGGPYWTIPLSMVAMKQLRGMFDGDLEYDPNLLAWGRETRKAQEGLTQLSHAIDHPLDGLALAQKLPEFAGWLRPYQRADVAYLARANAINANEQGLGKTPEIIAAVYEQGLEYGQHLVSAPVTSLEVVWKAELERWVKDVEVLAAEDPREREKLVKRAGQMARAGEPFWLVINPGMIRFTAIKKYDPYKGKEVEVAVEKKYPELFDIEWTTASVDEFQKIGLNEPRTLTARALYALKAQRRYALSGTPMGGKPEKLYGILRFIEPKEYSNKWDWINTWFDTTTGYNNSIVIGKLRNEEEFYAAHSRHMVRHLKSEVLPQLPPKQYVDVWCRMTPKQAKQYKTFAAEAEVRIDEQQLTATGILAEYARLKFFATAYCNAESRMIRCKRCKGSGDFMGNICDNCAGEGSVEKVTLKPTFDSGKLPYLLDKLSESGIDPQEPSGEAVAVVGSQSVEVCEMVHRYLNEQGIPTEILTGKTVKPGERARLVKGFQNGEFRVLVVSTMAGGVSITLDRADTVHILDETWVPDDQEQLEDRVHRASRIHQVTCFYYRSRDTVEQYIKEVNDEKAFTNESILDTRRNGFRAVK